MGEDVEDVEEDERRKEVWGSVGRGSGASGLTWKVGWRRGAIVTSVVFVDP